MKIDSRKKIIKRILEISYKKKLSHIGSCITAAPIIYDMFLEMGEHEKFILSQGHAGLALYVVLEDFNLGYLDAEKLFDTMGTHPDRDNKYKEFIDCSTGSLGHGLPIALGMALSDRTKNVWCLTSDGELAEGSCYETANIMRKYDVKNLKVYVNWNGYGGYDRSIARKKDFDDVFKIVDTSKALKRFPSLDGLKGHYAKFTEADYQDAYNRV